MKTVNVTMQVVTGPATSFDRAVKALMEKFHYVSKVMLVMIDAHPLDAAGPLFGFFLDVPNIPLTAASDGDFFVPLAPAYKARVESKFELIVKAFQVGDVGVHGAILRQAYESGPGPRLDCGDGKVILKDQTVRVLARWSPHAAADSGN